MEVNGQEIKCPKCDGTNIRKAGTGWKNKIRYVCKDCWKTFQIDDKLDNLEK